MFKLRKYQQEALDSGLEFFRNKKYKDKNNVLVLPTGAGKSIIIAKLAEALGENILVFAPSLELIAQNHKKYENLGLKAGIFCASLNRKEIEPVTFASINSAKKKPELFKDFKYIIIDECHQVSVENTGMYKSFFKTLGIERSLGLTATPFKTKQYKDIESENEYDTISKLKLFNSIRPKFFHDIIHVTQIKELFNQGFLTPLKYIPLKWENKDLKLNSTGSNFSKESVPKSLLKNKVNLSIPKIIEVAQSKGRKHHLVFVYSVQDAEYLHSRIPKSAIIHANTNKKERIELVSKFKSGDIKVLLNYATFTTGFDFPELDNIIIGRPVLSFNVFYQMIGRGVRLAEGFSNYSESKKVKPNCSILDMCGNISRFGEMENWYLQKRGKKWYLIDETTGRQLTDVKLEK